MSEIGMLGKLVRRKQRLEAAAEAAAAPRAKSGEDSIKGGPKAAMSLSVDSSGAALACMRAALEQVDLGARGGLATLGVKIPEPDARGLYKAQQFRIKDIERAQARVQNPKKVTIDDVEYLEAYRLYRAQPNVLAQQAGRRAGDEDRHSEYAKRPRAAVEVEAAGAGAAGRSRAGGGAYAREPCDCDVVEVGADEAAAEERARKRRREMEDRHAREREAERRRAETERMTEEERKMDEAWCEDMDGWYKGDW